MNIIELDINLLKPYEKNPRKNDAAVDYVANSIKEFGFKVPIVVDKDNVIVAGHTRYKAGKKLNLKTVPCIIADDLTPEQIKAYRLADNKVAEKAEWDFELLDEELTELLDFNFDMTDFGFDELMQADEPQDIIEDEAPEVDMESEPIAKLGDIWQLGNHRLMCGDSTDKTTVDKLMNGVKADMVFTDPPYGMKKEADGVLNDNLNFNDLLEFNKKWIPLTFEALTPVGSWYCWGIDEPLMDIYSEIIKPMTKQRGDNKVTFRQIITWDKGTGLGQNSSEFRMYPVADEKCLFVMKGRQNYGETKDDYWNGFEPLRKYFDDERKKTGLSIDELIELAGASSITHWWSVSQFSFPNKERYQQLQNALRVRDKDGFREEYDKIREEWYKTRAYFDNTHDNQNSVWHFTRTDNKERELTGGHATPKPIALCCRAIKSSSREKENVLDLFGGSGSTLIACEQLNRQCYMMELDPHYVDVIIKRWETLTGNKAVLLNGKDTEA